jgi:septal ring factor EnvC (AmiA/AmiB activator)
MSDAQEFDPSHGWVPPGNTKDIAADVLAAAVEKAVKLERERSDRETKIAVETAKQDAKFEHQLDGHEARLNAVNGSIAKTGRALDSLKDHILKRDEAQDKLNTENATREKVHWQQAGQAYSKKLVYSGFGAMIVMLLVPFVTEMVHLIAGQ